MRCPACSHDELKVLDSRPAKEREGIRRRRQCQACGQRVTTYETFEAARLYVVKRDGSREEFRLEKVLNGMRLACRKRPVSEHVLLEAAGRIEASLADAQEIEVASARIGELVMLALRSIDSVAYVRFASVYLAFETPRQFGEIVAAIGGAGESVPNAGAARSSCSAGPRP
jgi:transcriptional repressor NrdR